MAVLCDSSHLGRALFNFALCILHYAFCITHFVSEVRAADEVTLVDAVYRANGCTLTAAGTEVVIYGREVVDNLDSATRTSLLTLHTADTAVGADLSCQGALVVVRALNDNS